MLGFDQVQAHIDHFCGKVHPVPTYATDTAANAARSVLAMGLHSFDGTLDVLVVDHDPKFTSALFKELTRHIGSSLPIGSDSESACHKNTNAKAKRVQGVLDDRLRARGLRQRQRGRLARAAALRRLSNNQRGLDAGRRPDPLLH